MGTETVILEHRRPNKHQPTQIRRRQIIDAARKLIISNGSENVTIKGLAREVGISEGAIYRHFNEKRDILMLLVDDIGDDLLADIELSDKKNLSVVQRLNRIVSRQISAIAQREGISFQIIAEIISLGDKELNARMADRITIYIHRLQSLLEEGVRNNELRKDLDINATATSMFGMIQGAVTLWALNNYQFDLKRKYNAVWSNFRQFILNPD